MERKKALITIFSLTVLAGVGLASYPFFASLGVSAKAKNESIIQITIPQLEEGVVSRINVNGKQLFILKPSKEQARSIENLDDRVWNKEVDTYDHDLNAYVYWGVGTKWGCALEHKAPQESPLKEWDANAQWLGGFWGGNCEVSYDYAGRAIKTYTFTFSGYDLEHPNLSGPTVFKQQGESHLVSIWQR